MITVACRADARGDDLLAALDLPPPRGTVVLNGSTGDLPPDVAARLIPVLGTAGLAGLAAEQGLTVVTGGTDAGIFSILGGALDGAGATLIGVAPHGLVPSSVPLEPHHTHMVLVDGERWGDETGVLLELVAALCRRAPCVAVVCGGGPVTRTEVAGHLAARRPVIVLEGSGRFADELAAEPGEATVVPLSSAPEGLVAAVLAALHAA